MRIILYEDTGWKNLLPLVYTRAVFQLICGMGDLLARVHRIVGQDVALEVWCRSELAEIVTEQTGLPANRPLEGEALLLNGRGLWAELPQVESGASSWIGVAGDQERTACIFADATLAAELSPGTLLDEDCAVLSGLPQRDVSAQAILMDWPWEIVLANEDALIEDWHCAADRIGVLGEVAQGSYVLGEAVHVGAGTRVKPCVVIDAEDGPVWIGDNVQILPHSYIQGPAYIGDGSLLQAGAAVRESTYIGPVCKVGGEIEASIIQGYSNKQHDGFLGHSYVGSWVNIAADCINSDLKNTYGSVRVPINGREVDTGESFVGMLVGDHSKMGINVSSPTGAVIGFCSSVFAPRSPKFVPSFTWIDGDNIDRYDEERGLAIARKVMARRQKTMSATEEQAFLSIARQSLDIERQHLYRGPSED